MKDIKNPLKTNIFLALMVSLLGVMLVFIPGMIVDLGAYQFYCNYFGIVMIVGGIIFAIFYYTKYNQFKKFVESDKEKIRWDYEDEFYQDFVGELNNLQKKASKKKFFILLAVILALSVLLYFMLGTDMKMLSLVFGVFFTLISIIFVLIVPQTFRFKAVEKPYCSIISEDEAYIMGRYHSWKRANAKIKEHDNGHQIYKVLAINYESVTVNGKLYREWNALMPNQDEETLKQTKMISSKINKRTKVINSQGKEKDILERLFDKMLGRNKDTKEKTKTQKK
ncbi:MAG: hypothetical protein RR310_06405 [Eubacterium sp.]